MSDRNDELLQLCLAAQATGADFPTIWQEGLKRHPLIAGMPEQTRGPEGPVLEIPLVTGAKLRFGTTFSIEPAPHFWH